MGFSKEFKKGLWDEIPVLRVILGLCPTLAVTTSVENGIGMGLAATFVLLCSNIAVSALRRFIPEKVRIPCYIIVAATFTTIIDLSMNAFAHEVHKNLGIFIPLIVVNCIILGRAEAFAGKNPVRLSIADALGMGIGFTMALVVLSLLREVIGNGTLTVWRDLGLVWSLPASYRPTLLLILAPGGFVTLGCILGLMNRIEAARAARAGTRYTAPAEFDCRHCAICKWGSGK
ncbi:MAG: electron transport complex subunit E [Lentisphaerae bacterium]|nr:electron transport complex subunit E [Lentisphaerota bacterium]